MSTEHEMSGGRMIDVNLERQEALRLRFLRDEFAMAALTGLLSKYETDSPWQYVAKSSYDIADLMLTARERGAKEDV